MYSNDDSRVIGASSPFYQLMTPANPADDGMLLLVSACGETLNLH